jgi:DNA polymerase-3 subunit alpha
MEYVELRGHSQYSVGYATGKLDELFFRARDLGMKALCLSERDSLRGVFDLNKVGTEQKDVRPIYGIEIAVVDDMRRHGLTETEFDVLVEKHPKARDLRRAVSREERRLGIDRMPMVTLRAKTEEGMYNLYRLSSLGWTEGFYRRPRIDAKTLFAHAEGLEVSLGGSDAYIINDILGDRSTEGLQKLDDLVDVFGDDLHLEIHPHGGLNVQANQIVKRLAEAYELTVIATNDPRYVFPSDTDIHEIVLCLKRKRVTLADADHPRSQPGYYLRGPDELLGAFQTAHPTLGDAFVIQAIENTVKVAETLKGAPRIDPLRGLIPQVEGVSDAAREVKRLCQQGWGFRGFPERASRNKIPMEVYQKQLEHELEVFAQRKLEPYFLIVRDLINWCRENDIQVGPGRGSSAGSLACYLLGITSIDPLEHGLMFDRFLAPGRNDMPDIDTDFSRDNRDRVIAYIREKYGDKRVAHIGTHGVMHGRGALKDVCRVMGIPVSVVNNVTTRFSDKQGDEKLPVRQVLESFEAGQEFMKEYPNVMDVVERLEGSVRIVGVHASGILVSPVDLSEVCPIESHNRKGETTTISAVDMDGVSGFGLLKLDVLGLGNLDVLYDVKKAVWERHGVELDFEALTFDDDEVLQGFTDLEFDGVFQFDADSAYSVSEGLDFDVFRMVVDVTAFNRPGCTRSGMTESWKKIKGNPKAYKPLHPIYDEITKETLGLIPYQEQLIKIFKHVGGFSPEHADKMRKIIGKKLGPDEMEKHRGAFVSGAIKNGVPEDDADIIFDKMLKSAEYSFNLSHATAYAAVGYWEMWCKKKYPAEFVWALMNRAKDQDEAAGYVNEARRLGVEILGPDINESDAGWTLVDGNRIRAGLSGITAVGPGSVDAIVDNRPYERPSELFARVSGRSANARVIENLIRAGAMRNLFPNTKWALENRDAWVKIARAGKDGWEATLDELIAKSSEMDDYPKTDLAALVYAVCPQGVAEHPLSLYEDLFEEGGVLSGAKWIDLDDPNWFDGEYGLIVGQVADIKYKTMGEYEDKKLSDREKVFKGYGRRFAIVMLETKKGTRRRVKLEPDAFEAFGEILGRPKDKRCVAMCVDIYKGKGRASLRAHYAVDLEAIRQKVRFKIPLSNWERCFTKEHPIQRFSRKSMRQRSSPFDAPVLVTLLRQHEDKNGNVMAFFTVQDGHGDMLDSVAFESTWDYHGELIRPGEVIVAALRRERKNGKTSLILEDRGVIRTHGPLADLPITVDNDTVT